MIRLMNWNTQCPSTWGPKQNFGINVVIFQKKIKAMNKSQLIMSEKDNSENMCTLVPYRLSHSLELCQETLDSETIVLLSKVFFVPLIRLVSQGQRRLPA